MRSHGLPRTLLIVLAITVVTIPSGMATGAFQIDAAMASPTLHDAPSVQPVGVTGPLESVTPASPRAAPPTAPGQGRLWVQDSAAPLPSIITSEVVFQPSEDLQAQLNLVNNPNSPFHDQFENEGQMASQFGPSLATYEGAEAYFAGYGLSISPSPDRLTLGVSGSPREIQSAFHTELQSIQESYLSQGLWNPTFGPGSAAVGSNTSLTTFANVAPIQLPSSLARMVTGVTGMSGQLASPDLALPPGVDPEVARQVGASGGPASAGALNDSVALNDTYGNFTWMNTNTTELCTYYELCGNVQFLFPGTMPALMGASNLWKGIGTKGGLSDEGQGVTVALVEVGCIDPGIIANFSADVMGTAYQVLDRFTEIGVNITDLPTCESDGVAAGWTAETALDIEYLAAMAPLAHIDVVAVPTASFDDLFSAFPFIQQYLDTKAACELPFGTLVIGPLSGACSVSITSNSWGSGESYVAFEGAPMYLQVEDQLLTSLSLAGVTNFFASGDYGGAYGGVIEAGMPAISPGAVSVGGGQVTATGPEGEFPITGVTAAICTDWTGSCLSNYTMNVSAATGIGAFSLWAYGYYPGTYSGLDGGGFGVSSMETQPWWQNANDSYSVGTKIDPVVSAEAAFNMTIWDDGWLLAYGGTSFATPTVAGEWALLEEQVDALTGSASVGDAEPLLYEAHNAWQAHAPGVGTDPFVPMEQQRVGFDWAPASYWVWYLQNLSDFYPSDPAVPDWYATMSNPAGFGWNFLQGLGLPMAPALDEALVASATPGTSSLLTPSYLVEIAGTSGPLPFTTLSGSANASLEVVYASNGTLAHPVTIEAYSGGTNSGSYAGGTLQRIASQTGMFAYTPSFAEGFGMSNGSEFASFQVRGEGASPLWAYVNYAVGAPPASGQLVLGVESANEGEVTSGVAEISQFSEFDLGGYYNFGAQVDVSLGGSPVAGALVDQDAVSVQYAVEDPNLNNTSYAPGAIVGTWVTDEEGHAEAWANSYPLAENNGSVPTTIFTVRATYRGLVSNVVTLYVEPQSGVITTSNVQVQGSSLEGTLSFSDLRYVSWIDVNIGATAGQNLNTSFPTPIHDMGYNLSGVANGQIAFNLTPLPRSGRPLTLNVTAFGINDLSFNYEFFGTTYVIYDIQQNDWVLSLPLPNPSTNLRVSSSQNTTDVGVPIAFSSNGWGPGISTSDMTWTFGDGSRALGPNATHAFADVGHDTVHAWLNTSLGGSVEATLAMTINSDPTLEASVFQSLVMNGTPAGFDASPAGGTLPFSFTWHLGDGGISHVQDVTWTYARPGNYTAVVWANDSAGVSREASLAVQVVPIPVITVAVSGATGCGNFNVGGTQVSPGGHLPLNIGDYTLSAPSCPNALFTSWRTSGDVQLQIIPGAQSTITLDLVGSGEVTAIYAPAFQVSVEVLGGSSCGSVEVNGTSVVSGHETALLAGSYSVTAPTCAGHTFQGWSTSGKVGVSGSSASATLTVVGNGTVTATYTSSTSTSAGLASLGSSWLGLVIGLVVGLLVGLAAAVFLLRRRGSTAVDQIPPQSEPDPASAETAPGAEEAPPGPGTGVPPPPTPPEV